MSQRSTTPTLDAERIALIRTGVMGAVDADVRRRTRRARLVSIGAGVAAAVLVIGTGVQLVGSGPADVGTSSVPGVASGADDGAAPEPGVMEPDGPSGMSDASGRVEAAPGSGAAVDGQQSQDRSIVTTGSATVTVDDPAAAALELAAWAESQGGRIDQRTDRDEVSTLTMRIPAAEVTGAMEKLAELGDVGYSSVAEVDVTDQVVDLDARIAALQASVDRLTQLLAAATTTAEVIEAEDELTSRQAELQGLVAQRETIGERVELSTLEVRLESDPESPSVEPGGFLGGLRTGWDALVSTVNGAVEALGIIAPWAGILALGALAVAAVRRVRRARR